MPTPTPDTTGNTGYQLDPIENLVEVNIGPAHPATHGTLRAKCLLDGEVIVRAIPEIGYLHRGFEKMSENVTYNQVVPYTDRLNYLSAPMNNTGYAKAVEALFGIQIPDRAVYIRVIVDELSRIMDHLVCNSVAAMDLGGLTNFWYGVYPRERIYDILVKLTGARLTNSYTRVGGVIHDIYDGFEADLEDALREVDRSLVVMMKLLKRNRIFNDRIRDVGVIPREMALSYGFTGPLLRASGVPYDVRKDFPYYHYDEFDFDVPIGEKGDCWDRFFVRMEEIHQSVRILRQAVARIPDGPIRIQDPRITPPPKSEVYNNIEALINHFKLVFEGIRPPRGHVYSSTECANGEVGYTIYSDGTKNAYRVKVRSPSFAAFSAFAEIVTGHYIADAIAVLGSLNIIAGELDR